MAGLRKNVPLALASIEQSSIRGYFLRSERIIDAYHDNITYGTAEFQDRVHKTHRKLEDKSRW